MEIFLIIITIAIIFIYLKLNNKIEYLENEITQLRNEVAKNTSKDIKELDDLIHETLSDKEVRHKIQIEAPEPIIEHEIPQKEWITPMLIFLKQNVLT